MECTYCLISYLICQLIRDLYLHMVSIAEMHALLTHCKLSAFLGRQLHRMMDFSHACPLHEDMLA